MMLPALRRSALLQFTLGALLGFTLVAFIGTVRYCSLNQVPRAPTPPPPPHAAAQLARAGDVIGCYNSSLRASAKQRGDYWVLVNYVRAEEEFGCADSVTYTTHGEYTFLDNLPVLVERWRGPVSVALFAPGYDFEAALDSVAYLRNCGTRLVRRLVSFHVFFGVKDLPDEHNRPLLSRYDDTYYNCKMDPPYLTIDKEDTYRHTNNLFYPINVARNIARESAQTHFVFASDIELYPTRDFIPKFLSFVKHQPKFVEPTVFVLPLYEVKADQQLPETKTELQKMLKNQTAFVFHRHICLPCHRVPDGAKWQEENETEGLGVFAAAKRTGRYKFWEPFYVGTNEEPLFDERLTWEGQSNKMAQGYVMCLLNYTYLILDNAFLIHKPGIKKAKVQLQKYGNAVQDANKLLKNVIRKEFESLYGHQREC